MPDIKPNEYESLVFSGGGACGVSFAGGLKGLGDVPGFSYDNIKRAAGVSIGCIAALAVCLGLKPEEMFNRLSAIDFKKILDPAPPHKMAKRKAIFKGDYVYNELKKLLSEYTGRSDAQNITFADLKKAGFKDLYVITTEFYKIGNETHAFEKIHSFEHTPNEPVLKAIMCSIAIPFLFRPIYFDNVLNLDGGITNNFPYQLFHAKKYLPSHRPEFNPNDSTYINNPYTLGMTIAPFDPNLPRIPLKNFDPIDICQGVINGLLKRSYDLTMEAQKDQGTIIAIDRKIKLTEFDMTPAKKEEVLLAGAQAVSKTFNLGDIKADYCRLREEEHKNSCWAKLFGTNTSSTKPPILSKRMAKHARIYGANL